MRLLRVQATEVSALSDMVRKPYKMHTTQQHLSLIDEILGDDGSLSAKENELARALGGMASFSSEYEEVDIVGGYNQSRFRILIEIEVQECGRYGPGERVFLLGYSDRIDIERKEIASDTQIYINSYITVYDTYVDSADGSYISSRVHAADQLVLGRFSRQRGRGNEGNDYTSRPQDIFSMRSNLASEDKLDPDTVYTSTTFTSGVKTSARASNISGRYVSKIVQSDYEGFQESQTSPYGDLRDAQSKSSAADNRINSNSVLSRLMNETDIATERFIEYGQLSIFTKSDTVEEVDHCADVIWIESTKYAPTYDQMTNTYKETIIAYTLSHAVPALLSDCCLESIRFEVNNTRDFNGKPELIIYDLNSWLGDIDDIAYEDTFRIRFLNEIMPVISNGGRDLIDIVFDRVDVNGWVKMDINYNDQGSEPYNLPTFPDANAVPVLSSDVRRLIDITKDYDEFSNDIDDLIDERRGGSMRRDRADRRERDDDDKYYD